VPFIYVQPEDLLLALVGIKIMRLLGAKKLQQSAGRCWGLVHNWLAAACSNLGCIALPGLGNDDCRCSISSKDA